METENEDAQRYVNKNMKRNEKVSNKLSIEFYRPLNLSFCMQESVSKFSQLTANQFWTYFAQI